MDQIVQLLISMGADPTTAAATAARIMGPTMAREQPAFAMPGAPGTGAQQARPAPAPQAGSPSGFNVVSDGTGRPSYTTYEPPPEFTQQLADRYRVSPAQAKLIYNQLMSQQQNQGANARR